MPGESTADAANRRLQEELGVSVPLHYVGVFHYRAELERGLIENEVDHVFYGYYDQDEVPFNTVEVAATQWLSHTAWNRAPEPMTPWVEKAWSLVAKALKL